MGEKYVIAHDVGTGGDKGILTTMAGEVIAVDIEPYEVSYPREHCAEQDPAHWWGAVTATTRRLVEKTGTRPEDVAGISFATQMLGVLPMSDDGTPLCPGIIWMDCRAEKQARRLVRRLGGERVVIRLAGAVPSGKDVACKIKWLEEEQPDIYNRTKVFLDVKGYLVFRATGKFETDQTAASVTGAMDKKTRDWSPLMSRVLGLALDKMPPVRKSTDIVGGLTPDAAAEMGLPEGTPVISGMGDAPAAPIGGGALDHGDSVISVGTSGLLMISISKPVNLGRYGMASIASADPNMWLLTAEMNTAGGSLVWFAEQLATEGERDRAPKTGSGIFEVLDEVVAGTPPGARRVIFTPWMYGERSPVTDTALRGAFVNVSMDSTREDMLRAVYEGVAMNFRWIFEAAATKGLPCETVRAIGGGARSDAWMQIFADVMGRKIEAVENPQQAGAVGAALAVPLALGMYRDYRDIKQVVKVRATFEPDARNRAIYDELFSSFKYLYERLSPVYKTLNR
jgi:xylulokinase